jgi:hypothetical protein
VQLTSGSRRVFGQFLYLEVGSVKVALSHPTHQRVTQTVGRLSLKLSGGQMKKKLQVFISSTYTDMLEERQAVVEAILRAGHIPAGMELFASGDESQLETIRRWIDDSDVFMLILGGRYGSIEPNSGKSYVELEYDYAVETEKPFFTAVIAEEYLDAKVKIKGKSVIETAQGSLLNTFRTKVTSKICRFFKDPTELKLIVFESLSNHERNESLAGWVRGSDVLDPKRTLEEVTRLQSENTALRNKVQDLEKRLSSIPRQRTTELSDDAKLLLVDAIRTGEIEHDEKNHSIKVGSKYFTHSAFKDSDKNNRREEARWKAAIQELNTRDMVELTDASPYIYTVTKKGYDMVDKLSVKNENSSE